MRLVILDRDGVINEDSAAFIKSPEEWTPIPGSLEAIGLLCEAGFTVVVATNQSGVARGLFDEYQLARIHQKMQDALAPFGGHIDGVFYCPHGPADNCRCRKPEAGLFESIAREYQADLSGVPAVGDSLRDLVAAKKAGCLPILVRTGKGRSTAKDDELEGVPVVDDLAAAAQLIIARKAHP